MTKQSYRLFLDLDGVLADFEQGVHQVTGCYSHQLNLSQMWRALARSNCFFEHLPWTSEGKTLWEATKGQEPIILTGLPRGTWAEPQKRAWCARELGEEVPVITCMARDKIKWARAVLAPNQIPVIVDDRLKNKQPWVDQGGIFIIHRSVDQSLQELQKLALVQV